MSVAPSSSRSVPTPATTTLRNVPVTPLPADPSSCDSSFSTINTIPACSKLTEPTEQRKHAHYRSVSPPHNIKRKPHKNSSNFNEFESMLPNTADLATTHSFIFRQTHNSSTTTDLPASRSSRPTCLTSLKRTRRWEHSSHNFSLSVPKLAVKVTTGTCCNIGKALWQSSR